MRGVVGQAFGSRWMRVGLGLVLAAGCAAAVMAGARQSSAPDVVNVRLGGGASETRVVVDLHAAASGSLDDSDAAPTELTLILKGASTAGELKGVGQGLVRGWRVENGAGGARLVLDLAQSVAVERRFLLPPADGAANYRYVIDLAAKGPALARAPNRVAAAPGPQPAAEPAPAMQLAANVQAPPEHLRKVIVIDPGHGGRDSGAVGASSYEKNITLATALALKAQLERTGRYQVVMTRESDVYIPLAQRVQIARRAGADLFLSLHADSGSDPSIHGATVYTLSERGEQRVGYVLSNNEWFQQDASDDHAVGQILLDLTQRTTRNRSASFAQTLIANVGDRAPLTQRSQRDADYFVLLAPDVPAALLEMGFITNPDDEARLNDPASRAALAEKIAQSIDAFFNRGTRLAER
jgi:N-acetylmuramoyl-L-alanine amidase